MDTTGGESSLVPGPGLHAIAGCGTTDSLCEVQVSDPEPGKGVEVRVAATVSSN